MDTNNAPRRAGDDGGGHGLKRVVVDESWEVDAELHELGLNRDELLQVIEGAKWGRNHWTEWDPPGYAGWNQYALGTRSLRKVLIENRPAQQKWRMDNTGGLCRTIDPSGEMAIVVSSGTPQTGNPNSTPKTLNPKGEHSLRGFRINRSQRDLFGSDVAGTNPWLWFLLIHVDGDEVLAELSLPLDVDETGRVNDWLKRIIIRPDSPSDGGSTKDIDDDLDIDVVARAG